MEKTEWNGWDPVFDGENDFMCSVLIEEGREAFIKKLLEDVFEKASDRPDVFWEISQNNIVKLASKDPTPTHQKAVRQFLEGKGIKAESALVDIFSRELVTYCKRLEGEIRKTNLMYPPCNSTGMRYDEYGYYHYCLDIWKDPAEGSELLIFEKDGMFWLDAIFLSFIARLGKEGKKAKKELTPKCKDRYSSFVEGGKKDMPLAFKVWVLKKDPFSPEFFKILINVLWADLIEPEWEWQQGKHPALTRAVYSDIILPPLVGKTTIKKDSKNRSITAYNQEGKEIIVVANIDTAYFDSALTGINKFSSIIGHKLLRWQIDSGFINWKNSWKKKGVDSRLIVIDGGYGTLCEIIGCHATGTNRRILKSILHAQAFGNFRLSNGHQGNMIVLRELEFHRNKEVSKIEIVLGGFLMPNYTNIIQNRTDRRLIPIPKLPKLVGDRKTYAAQATLQLTVLKEFSDRSPEFANQGAIILEMNRWEELANESGLNPKQVIEVIDGWCEPDFNYQFLDRNGDQFTIATPFEDARNFLLEQGKFRLKKSKENKKRREKGEDKKRKKR